MWSGYHYDITCKKTRTFYSTRLIFGQFLTVIRTLWLTLKKIVCEKDSFRAPSRFYRCTDEKLKFSYRAISYIKQCLGRIRFKKKAKNLKLRFVMYCKFFSKKSRTGFVLGQIFLSEIFCKWRKSKTRPFVVSKWRSNLSHKFIICICRVEFITWLEAKRNDFDDFISSFRIW